MSNLEKATENLDKAISILNEKLEGIKGKLAISESIDEELILKEIGTIIDESMHSCESYEKEVKDKGTIEEAQKKFRKRTPILSESYSINRVRTWPQGMQGDYKTLEYVYKNAPLSEPGGIGYYLDKYMFNSPLAVAVKNRIYKLEDLLREELKERKELSVLNIACGSCREVFELSKEINDSKAKITCIDLDNDALSFAANRLSYTNISPLTSNQVTFRKYNALRMAFNELNMREFGKQDIIYSVGFFDYLQSDSLSNMLGSLYDLLNHGGKLITSFKDANKYDARPFHWLVDWDGFKQRIPEDFKKIFSDAKIPLNGISESYEPSGVIVFYTITKPMVLSPAK